MKDVNNPAAMKQSSAWLVRVHFWQALLHTKHWARRLWKEPAFEHKNRLEWRPRRVCGGEPMPQLRVDWWGRFWPRRLHQFARNLPETNNRHRAKHTGSSPLAVCQLTQSCFSWSLSVKISSISLFSAASFNLTLTFSICPMHGLVCLGLITGLLFMLFCNKASERSWGWVVKMEVMCWEWEFWEANRWMTGFLTRQTGRCLDQQEVAILPSGLVHASQLSLVA